jgi:hypothetical protein
MAHINFCRYLVCARVAPEDAEGALRALWQAFRNLGMLPWLCLNALESSRTKSYLYQMLKPAEESENIPRRVSTIRKRRGLRVTETLALSREWSAIGIGEMLAFPGAAQRPEKRLSASASELMQNIFSLLEDLVLGTVQKRTAEEFKAARAEAFPKYQDAVNAFVSLVRIVVPQPIIERLNQEFFCELEAELRENGLRAFGPAVRDQAVFTVWTLRKISDLAGQLFSTVKTDVKPTQEVADLLAQLMYHAVRTRFHVNCLVTSMQRQATLYPEVLELVVDGLRSAVNAYGLTKRLVDILAPLPELHLVPIEWDEEEEALLNEARRDMLNDFSEVV